MELVFCINTYYFWLRTLDLLMQILKISMENAKNTLLFYYMIERWLELNNKYHGIFNFSEELTSEVIFIKKHFFS